MTSVDIELLPASANTLCVSINPQCVLYDGSDTAPTSIKFNYIHYQDDDREVPNTVQAQFEIYSQPSANTVDITSALKGVPRNTVSVYTDQPSVDRVCETFVVRAAATTRFNTLHIVSSDMPMRKLYALVEVRDSSGIIDVCERPIFVNLTYVY